MSSHHLLSGFDKSDSGSLSQSSVNSEMELGVSEPSDSLGSLIEEEVVIVAYLFEGSKSSAYSNLLMAVEDHELVVGLETRHVHASHTSILLPEFSVSSFHGWLVFVQD